MKKHREENDKTSQKTAARIINEVAASEGIINAIAEGITVIDSTYKVIYENQAHKDMMGDHIGEYCYEAYQRKEGICGGCPVALTFKDGKVHRVQRVLQTERETKYFEVTSSPLKDSKGEVIAGIEIVRDITERQRVEAALRFSEERYRSTVDFLDDAIHVADENFDILLINKKLLEWHNHFGLRRDVIGKNVFEVYPFLPGKVQAEYESVFQTGTPLKTEESLLINGEIMITETKKIPIFEDGKVTKVITIIHDITERKHIEEALRESEKRFKAIFDNAPDGILLADSATKRFYLGNKTICEKLGYSEEEIKNLAVRDIHPEKDLSRTLEQFEKQTRREIELAKNIPVKRRDGSVFYADINSFPVTIAGKQYTAGIFRDITDRKWIEETLKYERDRAWTYFNIAEVVMLVLDTDKRVIRINRKGCEILGYKEKEIVGKDWFDMFVPERIRSETKEVFMKIIAGDMYPVEYFENPVLTKNGEERVIAWHNTLVKNELGNVIGALSSGEDITERKKTEEQLLISLREKEILLRELYHRTKNSLQVISSLLTLDAMASKDTQILQKMKEIQDRIKAISLVHEKLYQSKDLSNVNFKDYIKDLATALLASYEVSRGRISLALDVDDVFASIDTVIPCGLIINELVSNALKYAFPDYHKGEIRIGLHVTEKGGKELTVSDNGVGLSKDFDVKTIDSLGLKLVTQLAVKQLGGTIELRSEQGIHVLIRF
jgi:two-component system, cell cycle response regulator